ncbi:MAG: phage integrase SAM-like domain-containing protein [Dysgonomonas sp.]
MIIKRICHFLLDKEPDKADAKLRYRIKWDKNTVAFNVGYRVNVAKWSIDTQRCINNTTHGKKKVAASIINKEIQRFEQIAEDIFNLYKASEKNLTAEEFRTEFNKRNGKLSAIPAEKTFFSIYDEFTQEMGFANQWTKATFQKFAALKNHLTGFLPDITFNYLDTAGLNNFIAHLRDVQDMRNSTIGKQIGFLKWFLRWAEAKGYNNEKAYLTFSPKLKTSEKKVVFLDWDELMAVYNYKVPEHMPGIARVRDVFCFCCFTGLRYSDVANLKRSDVFSTYISITTVKTADSLKIELNDFSSGILKKYAKEVFPGNLALPVISNQKMNDAVKELGELCGIDKPVTVTYYKGNERIEEVFPKYSLMGTHTGRRTFICNALMLGISPQVVMKWTGHCDYKAMKPYIDVADKAKIEAMDLFNKKKPAKKKSPKSKNGD